MVQSPLPTNSGFKFQIVAISFLCAMPHTQALICFFVETLLHVFLEFFPDALYSFSYNSSGPSDYWYEDAFHIQHSLNLYTSISIF
jgi:hypothetical protein